MNLIVHLWTHTIYPLLSKLFINSHFHRLIIFLLDCFWAGLTFRGALGLTATAGPPSPPLWALLPLSLGFSTFTALPLPLPKAHLGENWYLFLFVDNISHLFVLFWKNLTDYSLQLHNKQYLDTIHCKTGLKKENFLKIWYKFSSSPFKWKCKWISLIP